VLLSENASPNPGEADALGKLLRERLKAANIAPAPVLACVSRDRVIIKEVKHPDVPAHEEPAVVRFQAVKELTDNPEEVVIDYTPLPSGAGGKRAQVLVIRKELFQTYQTLCNAAGLRLAGLTPRPHGMAACLRKLIGNTPTVPAPEPADAAVALVTVGEKWAEFCILRGDCVLQARSLNIGPGLAGEIRRNIAVHAGQSPQSPVRALYLALTGEFAMLREKLAESLEIPVHPFDPFAGAESPQLPSYGRGTFAGAVGLLHLQSRPGGLPVNFTQVKQATAQRDPNSRLYLLVAALLISLLCAGGVLGFTALQRKKGELAEKVKELADLDKQLAQKKEAVKLPRELLEWEGVCWSDELYELAARLPRADGKFKVRSLVGEILKPQVKTGPGAKTAAAAGPINSREAAKVHLTMDASDEVLARLTGKLLEPDRDLAPVFYRGGNQSMQRGVYEKDIFIRRRAPSEYIREFPKAAAPKPEDKPPDDKKADDKKVDDKKAEEKKPEPEFDPEP
jgi:hypothetical protein